MITISNNNIIIIVHYKRFQYYDAGVNPLLGLLCPIIITITITVYYYYYYYHYYSVSLQCIILLILLFSTLFI